MITIFRYYTPSLIYVLFMLSQLKTSWILFHCVCMCLLQFFCLFTCRQLGCLHILTIVTNVTMDMGVQISSGDYILFLVYIPRKDMSTSEESENISAVSLSFVFTTKEKTFSSEYINIYQEIDLSGILTQCVFNLHLS